MSGRLDQSLDSIIDSQKKAKREVRRRKVGKPTGTAAPVGGVKKSTKPAKSAIKPSAGSAAQARSSKIVVSGLVCFFLCSSFIIPMLTLSSTATRRQRSPDQGMLITRLIDLGFRSPHVLHLRPLALVVRSSARRGVLRQDVGYMRKCSHGRNHIQGLSRHAETCWLDLGRAL
jgi:hypothetical protein